MIDFIPGGARTVSFIFTFVGTLASGVLIIPLLKRLKVGQTIREDGPASHLAKSGVPTIGGLIFIVPATVVLAVLAVRNFEILPPLLVILGFGTVGFTDDLLKVTRKSKDGLTPLQKTAGLVVFAVLFSTYAAFNRYSGTDILLPLTGSHNAISLPFWLHIPLTAFIMYGTSNAVNLNDGVDGLAAFVTFIVMASFSAAAILGLSGDGASVMTAAFAGGCLGFLFYNAYPARVIMGDCGSLALGGAVSAAAVLMRVHWILLFFGIVYAAEAVSVIIQVAYFKRTGRRIFKMSPIHHHFELSGWSENRIVFVFTAVTFVFCCAGLGLLFWRAF
jgi:phospho-N-acetylmuramoyl-pentapeptide-transferase